jgi:hypothetical protein
MEDAIWSLAVFLGNFLRIVRSILAILAGLITVVALSIGTDVALQKAGIFPSFETPQAFTTTLLLAATVYRSLYAVVGGYIAARLAPSRPVLHALILGAIGFALAILGAVMEWSAGNHWYPIALVLTALPCSWLGGKLKR